MFQANEKDTKYGFSPDGEKFLVDSLHAGVLTAHILSVVQVCD